MERPAAACLQQCTAGAVYPVHRPCFFKFICPQAWANPSSAALLNYFIARYRNTAICAQVQLSSGLNVTADVPFVTPFSTAHATALAQKESAATSAKPLAAVSAVPSARYRNVTI